jgi:hypothetical protein
MVQRQLPDELLLLPDIKEKEPFVNIAQADNLMEHKWILPKEFMHFFLVESFNDDEQASIVCIWHPSMTVPFSKSLSINAACSAQ